MPHPPLLSPATAVLTVLLALSSLQAAQSDPPPSTAARLQAAAAEFLAGLSPAQRTSALFPFEDPERKDWSNLPHTIHPRKGIRMGDLTPAQRIQAHRLIESGLSSQGYLKATGIMQLDEVLLQLSGQAAADKPMFGLNQYWLSFLGDPASGKPWGWQLDGHHLALNFTVVGEGIAMTPTFLGSDPHEVRGGPQAGWRVLGAEDDKGLALMRSLTPAQQARALFSREAPGDVLSGPGKDKALSTPEGLPASELTPAQRAMLVELVEEYAHNYRHDLAHQYLDQIQTSGWDRVHFSWAGPLGPSAPYYYRVHGPTVLIEFDNNHAPGRRDGPVNHIHSVFRDPRNDYGEDLLRRHLEQSHGLPRR